MPLLPLHALSFSISLLKGNPALVHKVPGTRSVQGNWQELTFGLWADGLHCNEACYKNLHGFKKVLFSLQGHHGSLSFMGMVQHALFTQ